MAMDIHMKAVKKKHLVMNKIDFGKKSLYYDTIKCIAYSEQIH
jgi:hypothetical protein